MNQRQKGARGEREAAHELNRVLGLAMRRGVQFSGGPESPDVVGLPGVHLEVKRVEKLNLEEAMKQAERDCGGSVPVVMHRRNNRPWLWTFRLEDVERLILAVRKAAGQDGVAGMPIAGAGRPLESLADEKTGSDMGLAGERVESHSVRIPAPSDSFSSEWRTDKDFFVPRHQ